MKGYGESTRTLQSCLDSRDVPALQHVCGHCRLYNFSVWRQSDVLISTGQMHLLIQITSPPWWILRVPATLLRLDFRVLGPVGKDLSNGPFAEVDWDSANSDNSSNFWLVRFSWRYIDICTMVFLIRACHVITIEGKLGPNILTYCIHTYPMIYLTLPIHSPIKYISVL